MDEFSTCGESLIDSAKCLLLDMARERAVDSLPQLIANRLEALSDVALARLWLIEQDPDETRHLQLVDVESPGAIEAPEPLRRIPLGEGPLGELAAGQSLKLVQREVDWVDRNWAGRHRVRGFVGQPLESPEGMLGVLGVFLRKQPVDDEVLWLRMVADHAASAVANARAFEEIDHLRTQLQQENEYLRDEVKVVTGCCNGILGASPALQKVLQQVEIVAPTESTVLVLGESGVGKELIARAIHDESPRRDGPLIKVNCASVPRELFESEFFGHVQGAFTGALRDRAGRFEVADGGTLFLDEVGEIPLDMQSKLLRVLQESTYERIGEERTRSADVRIVAATNRDLEQEVAAKRFRQDLYYRLSVFPIEVIPLRERREDIPLLARSFLESQARKLGLPVPKLKVRQVDELQRYDWPGNVRELQNAVERAVIRSRTGPLEFDLPRGAGPPRQAPPVAPAPGELLTDAQMQQLERDNVRAVLERHQWKISGPGGAAEFLGVNPATLASRIKKMDLRRDS